MVYQLGLIVSLFCGFFAGSRWLTVDSEMQSSGTIRIPVVIPSVNGCSDNYDFIHPDRIAVNAYPAEFIFGFNFLCSQKLSQQVCRIRSRTKNQHIV